MPPLFGVSAEPEPEPDDVLRWVESPLPSLSSGTGDSPVGAPAMDGTKPSCGLEIYGLPVPAPANDCSIGGESLGCLAVVVP